MSSIAALPALVGTRSGREPSICLCMIVRNEARVLERCLDAVRPILDAASICDTGSTDGTAELAQAWLEKNRGSRAGFIDIRSATSVTTERSRCARRGVSPRSDRISTERTCCSSTPTWCSMSRPDSRAAISRRTLYSVVQRNAGLVYANVRLARASLAADVRWRNARVLPGSCRSDAGKARLAVDRRPERRRLSQRQVRPRRTPSRGGARTRAGGWPIDVLISRRRTAGWAIGRNRSSGTGAESGPAVGRRSSGTHSTQSVSYTSTPKRRSRPSARFTRRSG